MTEPNQVYVQTWKRLKGQKATANHASLLLEKCFLCTTGNGNDRITTSDTASESI